MGKYETPEYSVIFKEDDYEIRKYDGFFIVEHDNKQAGTGGFNSLFSYISSDNKKNEKISMTTPVIQKESKEDNTMSFVIPEKFGQDIPEPNNPNIKIKKFHEGLYGVIRYSGFSNRTKESNMNKKLEEWIEKNGYKKESDSMLAFYNPPFTLPMFRRNEIWIRVIKI